MAAIKTEAIVLKKINYRETSVLLDLFTLENGKIRGILKGVRSKKSKISPLSFTVGSYIEGFIYPRLSPGLTLLSSPVLINYFNISTKSSLKVWHLILSLVNKFMPDNEKSKEIFSLLTHTGIFVEKTLSPEVIFVGFKIKFIKILGYGVELNTCVSCRRKTNIYQFSGKAGGILCAECKIKDIHTAMISKKVLSVMKYFNRVPVEKLNNIKKVPAEILEKINFYLNLTLQYHTEIKTIWWGNEKNIFR